MSRTREWLYGVDESGTKQTAYYGFGILAMASERRGQIHGLFKALRERHGETSEIKWNKVTNQRRYDLALALVDAFFRHEWMAFHCIVIRKGVIRKELHGGDYDLAWRKNLGMFLENKISKGYERHPSDIHQVRIWADKVASRYAKAAEAIQIIANNRLRKKYGQRCSIVALVEHDSREKPNIQLCDLLLGAVVQSWSGRAGPFKVSLQQKIAEYLGWGDLRAGTFAHERKFNIWHFCDRDKREVAARGIRLMYAYRSQRAPWNS